MATASSRQQTSAGPSEDDSSRRRVEALDTTVRLITPERIVFEYPLAGPFRRLFAYLLDLLVVLALVAIISIVSTLLTLGTASGMGPILIGYFALVWGYGAFFEGLFNGQTPGKRGVGIRVVSDQCVPITGAQAVLRNLVGSVDGLFPFCFLTGLTSMVLTNKFQRLGDLAAGTMVIVEERQRRVGVIRLKEPAVDALLPWLPVRIAAGPEMARALSDYVKSRGRFSAALREEMARPLAKPLRTRFALPADATSDIVLCAVYHRVFLGE